MATAKTTARKTDPKTPQDHMAKAEATNDVLTASFRGVEVSVRADDLDDYEAVTMLTKGLPDPILEVLVPDDADRQRLIETCRDEEGRIRLSAVVEMASDLMGALGAGN
ncbi:hypothetical protein [Actinomyces faecalis]|uniref:hypothetical protein n=1 Tax=Actinomyces faecalis TaxID=2722820 RepID=UPI0015552ECB|nr:hypothetical protein [Actinomyces faecalis]